MAKMIFYLLAAVALVISVAKLPDQTFTSILGDWNAPEKVGLVGRYALCTLFGMFVLAAFQEFLIMRRKKRG